MGQHKLLRKSQRQNKTRLIFIFNILKKKRRKENVTNRWWEKKNVHNHEKKPCDIISE